MRLTTGMMAGLGLMGAVLLPAQVSGEPKIYAYPSSANYCPAGLQPITISGVICCGTPNTSTSYQQMMAHQPRDRFGLARRHAEARAQPFGDFRSLKHQ